MTTQNTTGHGIDNRVKCRLNQERVLLVLHRFGWLPVRQVHQACWPDKSTPRNAQEYLAQLLKLKQVAFKQGPDGSRVYALTAQGARRLRAELGVEAMFDADFTRRAMPTFQHRCLANDACLWWSNLNGPTGYYTEHEIATGRAPVTCAPQYMTDPLGKIPDALLTLQMEVNDENPYSTWYTWVEVENSEKSKAAHEHMVTALCDVIGLGKQPWEIGSASVMRFAIVVCPHLNQESKLVEGMLKFLGKNKANYDARTIVNRLYIWRPGAEEGIALRQWIEERPAYLALRDKHRLWWPAPPKCAATD
jgi:hypothetical protein